MLKILAVRVLNGCATHIQKCLHKNVFYYLCHDYIILEDGKYIENASKFVDPLNEDFFSLFNDNSGITINLQAIVGMNGDGKSSLVELIIRILNNCACEFGMNPNNNLIPVDNVCAELYFMYEKTFYCLKVSDDESGALIYSYEENEEKYIRNSSSITKDEIDSLMFYTLISNYSHYAYNTYEFTQEWKDKKISYDENDCWIHRVFHKNDSYQSPLSLHPYRTFGNIDVNRESGLSKSRLGTLFVNSNTGDAGNVDHWGLSGKSFYGFKLTYRGYSKLQKIIIEDFFKSHRDTMLLSPQIDTLESLLAKNKLEDEDKEVLKDFIGHMSPASNKIRGGHGSFFNVVSKNVELFRGIIEYFKDFEDSASFFSNETDVKIVLQLIKKINKKHGFENYKDEEIKDILEWWKEFQNLNMAQIQRIELIDYICDQWSGKDPLFPDTKSIKFNIAPSTIVKDYSKLSDEEKCQHYIIYKTINIFETYPEYGYPCKKYEDSVLFFGENKVGFTTTKVEGHLISEPFEKLAKDWKSDSHITSKIRQTYNFMCADQSISTREWYNQVKEPEDVLAIAKIREKNGGATVRMDQMPPAIYEWDLVFKTSNGKVYYDMFSSGEKQKLNSLAAVIYHINNINSLGDVSKHYSAVNIIMEEIELYFHPEWQRSFCYDMMELIKKTIATKRNPNNNNIKDINIIFVTHSPYILSDIPKTNVLFLRKGLPYNKMQENTFGANINSLLKNGFFMPSLPMGKFAHEKIDQMFEKLHSGAFDKEKIESIEHEIMVIGEPYIRQQLITMLKIYKQIDESELKRILLEIKTERLQ